MGAGGEKMSIVFIKIIRFYQKYISAYTPARCRFYPTCSSYSLQAFEKYGFFKGFYLSVKRILKCNPLFKGGYDPLP
jgi:putative membrane protein insertion efficiency factor